MSGTAPTAAGASRPASPASVAPSTPQKSKVRRSWLTLSRRTRKNAKNDSSSIPPAPPSAFEQHQHLVRPSNTLIPIQFEPNRIATLYVTPSERNLYLAAMAQLDAPPQALPLWADPAPKLPGPPPLIDPVIRGFSPAPYPLTTAPLSPKLVTSPGLPESGLQIREEFRAPTVQAQPARHALVSLVPNSFLRFTGFPPETIVAVDRTLTENWPMGVYLKSEEMDAVRRKEGDGQESTWRVELHGRAWRRKGSQELDSVRLVLALLTTLGVHGWTLIESVQAAGLQKATHNLLFRHSSDTQAVPPAFFAVSLPLPDRISVISAPNKITPAVLTAIREAITSNSYPASTGHSRSGTTATAVSTATSPSKAAQRVTWGKELRAKGIKEEGWVHPGVYRFWVAGMRRWLGGGVKADRIEDVQPQLLISLISNLSGLGFDLTASIPLLPVAKGRDILYFASTLASGLTYLDTFRPDASVAPNSRNGSPVLVSPSRSLSPAATAPNVARAKPSALPARAHQRPISVQPETAESQRVLPWTSILSDDPPVVKRSPSKRGRTRGAPQSPEPDAPPVAVTAATAVPREVVRRLRTTSQDSCLPLSPGTTQDPHPKQRNVLLKKNSIRRRSISRTDSVDIPATTAPPAARAAPPPAASTSHGYTDGRAEHDEGRWAMIDIPRNGLVAPMAQEPTMPPFSPHAPPAAPPPANRLPPVSDSLATEAPLARPLEAADYQSTRPSFESNEWVYQEDHEAHPDGLIPPAAPTLGPLLPNQGPHMAQNPLGQPPAESTLEQHETGSHLAPLRNQATARRAGSAMVDVAGGTGVPSMHGSLGFYPGSTAPSNTWNTWDKVNEVSPPPPVPPPKIGTSRTKITIE